MRLHDVDFRLIIGLIIAHFLLLFSFQDSSIFWYIYTGSLLLLIIYSMNQKEVDDKASFFTYIFLGVISGLLFYGLFWIGNKGFSLIHLPVLNNIHHLYHWYAPSYLWQYLALFFVVVPGEELFWRGFIQKRLMQHFKPVISIIIGAILYASVQIYSGEFILVLAFFLAGLAWGALYFWKKSMSMIIVSHLIFTVMLFIFFPLN